MTLSWSPPWVRVAGFGGPAGFGIVAFCYRCDGQRMLFREKDNEGRAKTLARRLEAFAAKHIHCPRPQR
jgi:hypothetical protein